MALHPIIMAGGSGTRFWPLSRKSRPKQFLPLASDAPLIVDTAERLEGLVPGEAIRVVCGPVHAKATFRLLSDVPRRNIIVEPVARNTAPAIALAALHVAREDPKGVMVVLPSDHHVANPKAFRIAIRQAARVARTGALVTLGIQPTRPETGYGYIRVGAPLEKRPEANRVEAFVEKPDLATAKRYLKSGRYLWNGGIFVFRADAILAALRLHMPELAPGLDAIAEVLGTRKEAATLARVFRRFPSISIDYGVMEKADNLAVVGGDFGWSDVGSFAALPEVRSADAQGNVVSGRGAVVLDSEGCVVHAEKRPIAVVGMKDTVVVDTGDTLLVVPKDRAQEVRKAVDAFKARRLTRYL
ncbi:MAG TPA: mannose-1-phosphate guanylyltransferase [Myxococcaceae bacterium]|nr:mannose-1-phosphate guanylyltransferase [Myxococcaceae bacterium]